MAMVPWPTELLSNEANSAVGLGVASVNRGMKQLRREHGSAGQERKCELECAANTALEKSKCPKEIEHQK
jgi:hypothetical protein